MQQNFEYIYAIYELGNIKHATEKLCITQPALSIALKKTEEEFGALIFDRSTHPWTLTPAGKILINGIKEIKLIEDNVNLAVNDLSKLNTGTLNIGGTQYFTSYILPPVLKHFMNLMPNIKIHIEEASSDMITEKLLNNKIDLMFSAKIFDSNRFYIRPIFRDTLFISVPACFIDDPALMKYSVTHRDVVNKDYSSMMALPHIDMLKNVPFIFLTDGNNLCERSKKIFLDANVNPKIIMQVEQLATAHYFSCIGIAATFTTDMLIKKSSPADVLYFKLDTPLMLRDFNIVMRKKHYQSNAVRKFIELCRYDLGRA